MTRPSALAGLVARFRRADPVVRQQLKWVLAAAAVTVVVNVLRVPLDAAGGDLAVVGAALGSPLSRSQRSGSPSPSCGTASGSSTCCSRVCSSTGCSGRCSRPSFRPSRSQPGPGGGHVRARPRRSRPSRRAGRAAAAGAARPARATARVRGGARALHGGGAELHSRLEEIEAQADELRRSRRRLVGA